MSIKEVNEPKNFDFNKICESYGCKFLYDPEYMNVSIINLKAPEYKNKLMNFVAGNKYKVIATCKNDYEELSNMILSLWRIYSPEAEYLLRLLSDGLDISIEYYRSNSVLYSDITLESDISEE